MEDEFDRIVNFFSLDDKEKEARLQEIFSDSVAYFERFRNIMMHGTPEEKQEAIEKVSKLKERVEMETKKVCEKTGLTEEQLLARAKNPANFSEDQWNALTEAQKKIESGVREVKEKVESSEEKSPSVEKKKPKPKKKSKKWIPS
ncbi:MAG: hypothetical protein AAF443_03040 [Chlamydiota bacterium]